MRKQPQVKVGDIVALEWWDIVSYGRVAGGTKFPLAVFVSYGEVLYEDADQITLLHEKELEPIGEEQTQEPTSYPRGCIRKLTRLRA